MMIGLNPIQTGSSARTMGWEEGQDMPPGVRSDILACSAKSCPLHGAKPYQ